jgi:hypothetical protein
VKSQYPKRAPISKSNYVRSHQPRSNRGRHFQVRKSHYYPTRGHRSRARFRK